MKTKVKTFVSVATVLSIMFSNFALVAHATAEAPLSHYDAMVDEFNLKNGTSYCLANEEQLQRIGITYEDHVEFITSMNDAEFYEYLNGIRQNELNSASADIYSMENNYSRGINDLESMNTQTRQYYYYYGGSTSRALYMDATWVSIDGQNRYMSFQGFSGYTNNAYPCQVPTYYNATMINYSTQIQIYYTYDIFIAPNMVRLVNWTLDNTIIFTANGGNLVSPINI